jgi:hypothetical protein
MVRGMVEAVLVDIAGLAATAEAQHKPTQRLGLVVLEEEEEEVAMLTSFNNMNI